MKLFLRSETSLCYSPLDEISPTREREKGFILFVIIFIINPFDRFPVSAAAAKIKNSFRIERPSQSWLLKHSIGKGLRRTVKITIGNGTLLSIVPTLFPDYLWVSVLKIEREVVLAVLTVEGPRNLHAAWPRRLSESEIGFFN